MRQVSIRNLRANLSKELNNLPFEVIKHGKVVGIMCTQDEHLGGNSVHNDGKVAKKRVHKQKAENISHLKHKEKATSHTGETQWVNPLAKTARAPKK
jgi:hypothetical protein